MAEDESADWSDGAWRMEDEESAAPELELELEPVRKLESQVEESLEKPLGGVEGFKPGRA